MFVENIKGDLMKTNIEIEFKTAIPEETYYKLLKEFNLENNIFKQTNYYFDTDNYDLMNQEIVLRIRLKPNEHYKVTLKSQGDYQAFESHVILKAEQALSMIENGFYTNVFFKDTDYFVTFKASLENHRVSTPYENGTLFLDRCDYHGITDYEVEYEAIDYETGKRVFEDFLSKHGVENIPTKRKSQRALKRV